MSRSDFRPSSTFKNSNGYIVASNGVTLVRHHVWLYEQHFGPIPRGYELHHVNQCRTDNSLDNLELMRIGDHRRLHIHGRMAAIKAQVRMQKRDDAGRWVKS